MKVLLLAGLALSLSHAAEARPRNFAEDLTCAELQERAQRLPYRQTYVFWRDGNRTRWDIAYGEKCPVEGFKSRDLTLPTRDDPACTVGLCCVSDARPNCGGA